MRHRLAACALLLPTLALGAPTRDLANPRVSLTGYGWLAHLPAPPTTLPPTTPMLAGCGGGGATFVPEREVRRGRGHWEVLPSHRRIVVRAMDTCGWIGASQGRLLAPLQVGYGGQWGWRHVYVASQIEGGLGNFHRDQGLTSINDFGVALKPRLALGVQIGPVGVEIGPTARALVPVVRTVHNSPVSDGVFAAASFDLEVTLGAGVGPVRWYQ